MDSKEEYEKEPARILLVEDSPTQAMELEYILERHGYQVMLAGNGREALAALREQRPRIVISDVVMPEMNGYDLCAQIKADPEYRDIPVILLTSLADPEDVVRGLECGADNFITKPYEERYLLSRIEYTLANLQLRQSDRAEVGLSIYFAGRKYYITSDRLQILNLLLGTYEAAIQKNRELIQTRNELKGLNEQLEERVAERTAALSAEIAERKAAEEEIRRLNADLERRIRERTAQLEAANRAAEQARAAAERANQAKSEFLSRMSHELRTPLNAILGFAQLLQGDELQEDQQESVDYILKGGEHLLMLINEVLDISRIESGHLTLSPEPVELRATIEEALALIQPLVDRRAIQLHFEADDLDDVHVLADRQRLKQVLLNLLSNAVKYNRERGMVVVSVDNDEPESLCIRVRDTGPGIPRAWLDRLFTPFDRLGAEQSDIEGTGLGLALSRGLVTLMGGEIGVESVVGEGSTFWVKLCREESPVERFPEVSREVASRVLSSLSYTVLSIEDNPSNLRLIEFILARRPGITFLSAMQGRAGLEIAREARPDVILLDLNLPDIAGQEVLRRLQGDPDTRDIPVLILSADASPGQIERLVAAGARDYLTKPLAVKPFLDRLDELLLERSTMRGEHEQKETNSL